MRDSTVLTRESEVNRYLGRVAEYQEYGPAAVMVAKCCQPEQSPYEYVPHDRTPNTARSSTGHFCQRALPWWLAPVGYWPLSL